MKNMDSKTDRDETAQTDKESASKRADAGAAPEQADSSKVDTNKADTNKDQDDELVDPREKRQDPPVPGQPKKIRVEQ